MSFVTVDDRAAFPGAQRYDRDEMLLSSQLLVVAASLLSVDPVQINVSTGTLVLALPSLEGIVVGADKRAYDPNSELE